MARTLDRSQTIFHVNQGEERGTYAHTWLPCSGTTVKRNCSLLSWSQTSLPKDERDAVSPGLKRVSKASELRRLFKLTGEGVDVSD